jgi:NADH-quinone oxidoreductase subunit J
MEGLSLSVAAFYLLAGLTLAGAGGVAFSRNIVYSALSLMASFMGVAGLYILLRADFVAGVQVLLYVGGVVVLTLFAVMLTQHIADVQVSNRSVGRFPALAICLGVFVVMARAYSAAAWRVEELPSETYSTYAIGNALLGEYVLPFELASVVLLAVLVGAVVLSRKELVEEPSERLR